jgi:hypothetical protein
MENLRILVKLSIKVNVNNADAMSLEKIEKSEMTKHVDTMHNYVQTFIKHNFVKINFRSHRRKICSYTQMLLKKLKMGNWTGKVEPWNSEIMEKWKNEKDFRK